MVRLLSRRFLVPLLAGAFLVAGGCRGKHSGGGVQNEEPEAGPRISSSVKMSDATASTQLRKGFYGLESNAWRWTAGTFSVVLRPPLAAAQRGGTLSFAFSIPEVVIQKLKSVTLAASIGSTKLKSETYAKPGGYTFTADVPVELLSKDSVIVDFALDKSLPPGAVDLRELGVIATAVGLESK